VITINIVDEEKENEENEEEIYCSYCAKILIIQQ
jgi:hypothetical protein